MKAEDFIRKQIRNILAEGEEEPKQQSKDQEKPEQKQKQKKKKKRKIKGGGRGRVKASISQAGARASEEPAALLSDLGVTGAAGDNDAEKVTSLMRSAIYGNAVMSAAYAGAVIDQDGQGEKFVRISTKELEGRDAAVYIRHTLVAAQSVGMLSLDKDVSADPGGGGVIITFG